MQFELPYDPKRPLIDFDERPCFLIGEAGAILPMSPGKARRHHDEYEKNGSVRVVSSWRLNHTPGFAMSRSGNDAQRWTTRRLCKPCSMTITPTLRLCVWSKIT